jgi:AraC family transcriptional regulator
MKLKQSMPSLSCYNIVGAEVRGGLYPAAMRPVHDRSAAGPVTTLAESRRRLTDTDLIIPTETEWRGLGCPTEKTEAMRVVPSRWQSYDEQTREVEATTSADSHIVKIVLRVMNLSLRVDGRSVHDGIATPGMIHITPPGAAVKGEFRGPFDTLHLRVSNALIAECLADRRAQPEPPMTAGPGFTFDPTTERLARTLLDAGQHSGTLGPLYADCIGIAMVARLLGAPGDDKAGGTSGGMVKWRLRRTTDYIDAHLDEPIRLADMAAAAGLSRMHFAALFKASAGLRPHEYLLRRRIERAQEMLNVAGNSVVDIALAVGFQSQSHFTTTFARFVGQTPHAWRLAHGVDWRR